MHPEFYPTYDFLTMSNKAMVELFLLVGFFLGTVVGFTQHTTVSPLQQFSQQQQHLHHQHQQLPGFLSSTNTRLWAVDDEDVNVNLIPDVDAATLTAVGFGLIAFNFFVLANIGDGGLGGALATIINTLNQ